MIIKASQRADESKLSAHLLNGHTNEQVSVHELRGFTADDLKGALQEIRAVSLANKNIKKTMFSMSLNPPIGAGCSEAKFVDAADRAEKLLGLEGQQRAIVFHSKENRRHAHIVWSRIDENLKAIKLPYYKKALNKLSRELFLENKWELPKGFKNKQERDLTSFNLSEWQQAKRNNADPKEVKSRLLKYWKNTTDLASFKQALTKDGYTLAKGDKRGFVLVDINGDVKSLRRTLSVKTKDLIEKLGDSQNLPTIDDAKALIGKAERERLQHIRTQLTQRYVAQLAPHQACITALVKAQKMQRSELEIAHQQRQQQELKTRQSHYQRGLKGLWRFVTGQYHKQKQQHETEYQASLTRDADEKEQLTTKHMKAREPLQQPLNQLRNQHHAEVMMVNAEFLKSIEELGVSHEFTQDLTQSLLEPTNTKTSPQFEL